VDCDCPDYKYRWAYNNAKAGAGITGNQSWNGNNGKAPRPREQGGVGQLGEGLCKHLISLGRYLHNQVEPEQPEKPEQPVAKPSQPSATIQPKQKPTPTQPQTQEPPTDQEDPDPTMLAAPQPVKPVAPVKAPEPKQPVKPTSPYSDTRTGDIEDDDEDDTYSDSRGGDLTENQGSRIYQMMERFVRTHPEFDVPVYEDEKKPA
jgi:outer membrane biosynthesis protein TonB